MRTALVFLLALPTVACIGGDDNGKDEKPPASPEQGPAPYTEVKNAAPHHNVEGKPEQARTTMPQNEPGGDSIEPDEQLRTELRPVGKAATHGNVVLEEVADEVRVTVDLKDARRGTGRILLQEHSCDKVAAIIAHPGSLSQRTGRRDWAPERDVVARVHIDRSGEARTVGIVPKAHLRPDQPGTLLGKSLIVYQAKEIPGAARGAPVPVACAPVKEE